MLIKDKLNLGSERVYTDEGFLTVPACIAKTGVQNYTAAEMGIKDKPPTEIIKVYRPKSEVFSDTSLQSFANKPVTNDHPPVLVDTKNSKRYSVGMSANHVTEDGEFVKTHVTITEAKAIRDIEKGKCELSNGYLADIDWTPGISDEGEQYDAIQRNIKGNHIAIVKIGRAGSNCRLADTNSKLGELATMAKRTIDGVDFELPEPAAQAVDKLQATISDNEMKLKTKEDELKAKDDEMKKKDEEAKKAEDVAKAELDETKSKIPTSDSLDKMVEDRAEFVAGLLAICPEIKWQGRDSKELKAEALTIHNKGLTMDSLNDQTEGYVDARYDILKESFDGGNKAKSVNDIFSKKAVSDAASGEPEDTRTLSQIARDKFVSDSKTAYKTSGGND